MAQHTSSPLHPMTTKIRSLLEENKYWFEEFHHEAVLTSEEAALTRPGYSLSQGAKALIIRCKPKGEGKQFVLCVVPANLSLDNKKAKEILNTKDIRFANSEEVADITDNILPGAIPPFGNLFGLKIVFDNGFDAMEKICFNAGDRRYSIGMRTADFLQLARPHRGDIAENTQAAV
eukprot:TRINITY_DN698_c0_g1_i1.p1 TRINITY_DN698_c0_g1~~TRINITY_DN698_c0_g1_i1.p1  ORF type:complete len:176 (+),score=44.37 TRINITY_DN698_c0_g1_i1:162-689(+)